MSPETLYTQPDIDGLDLDDLVDGFDNAAAAKGAMHDVLSDESLDLDEKVRRATAIIYDASSDLGLGFHDLREMAAIAEMYCMHDHMLGDALSGSETMSSFLAAFTPEDEHEHTDAHKGKGRKNKKKKNEKKSRLSMFDIMLAVREARKKK